MEVEYPGHTSKLEKKVFILDVALPKLIQAEVFLQVWYLIVLALYFNLQDNLF